MMRKLLPLMILLSLCGPALAEDTVCIQCHAGQEGRLGAPVGQWKDSVHAENGISCNDCHGGDPTDFAMAMEPSRGFVGVPEYQEVPAFCGKCHLGVREDYEKSAHGLALESGGPQCVVCHGNHAVKRASIDLINEKSCTRCHSYERAGRVREAISQTEENFRNLEQRLEGLRRLGIDTKRLSGQLFSQRNSFRRLFHTVKVEKIEASTSEVKKKLKQVETGVFEIDAALSQRKIFGTVVVLLLLVAGCIAMLIRKSYHDEE